MSTPIRRVSPRFCARAAIGHATKPTTTPIKSRRLIVFPEAQETTSYRLKLVLRRGTGTRAVYAHECPPWVKSRHVRCTSPSPLFPQKQTCAVQLVTSAFGQKPTCSSGDGTKLDRVLFKVMSGHGRGKRDRPAGRSRGVQGDPASVGLDRRSQCAG